MPVDVGIVDSGLAAGLAERLARPHLVRLAASVAFVDTGDGMPQASLPVADPLGHGSQVAELILAASPTARLRCAQAFTARRPVAANVVAAGVRWCVDQGARVINLSLGLRDDRPSLCAACAEAVDAGVLLVASAPARGCPVFPAAYPGVLAVSGDARCAAGAWSLIDCQGLVGAPPMGPKGPGGASFAAARISGLAATFFDTFPRATAGDYRAYLQAGATFHKRERHSLEAAA
jgi:hypothetical protein